MGYNTDYHGVIQVTPARNAGDNDDTILGKACDIHKFLSQFEGVDIRDSLKEWQPFVKKAGFDVQNLRTYIDLEMGVDEYRKTVKIVWDGGEKSYDMAEKLKLVILRLYDKFPDVTVSGEFLCNGEDRDDNYRIIVENSKVYVQQAKIDYNHGEKIEV